MVPRAGPCAIVRLGDGARGGGGGGALDEPALHPRPFLGVQLPHLVPYLLGEQPRTPLLPVPRHPRLPPRAVHPRPHRHHPHLRAMPAPSRSPQPLHQHSFRFSMHVACASMRVWTTRY
ncbi:Os02g0731800 [Oryza sativa Japonica Group]|uniref:Os02g0731800 protein n=1 Tax=Oryza sativa subsp. japonica TaxID=39947 RepID=A0A0P0VPB0_ORYSJ|nr:hypothetical protein EE612_013475 [Oryza sativa]BAS80758.1 Os02g0731800 [Oryza sativa Japonica Group]